MNSAEWLVVYVLSAAVIFAWWDVGLYSSGKQTMSRWVINKSKRYKWAAWIALAFSTLLAGVGFWLMLHWELLCILFGWFCGISERV